MRGCREQRGGEPNAGEPPSYPGLGWSLLQVPVPAPPLPKSMVLLAVRSSLRWWRSWSGGRLSQALGTDNSDVALSTATSCLCSCKDVPEPL